MCAAATLSASASAWQFLSLHSCRHQPLRSLASSASSSSSSKSFRQHRTISSFSPLLQAPSPSNDSPLACPPPSSSPPPASSYVAVSASALVSSSLPLSSSSLSPMQSKARHFSTVKNHVKMSISDHESLVQKLVHDKTTQFSLESKQLTSEEGLAEYWQSAIENMEDKQRSPTSRRTGMIGQKMGMMHVWDHWGVLTPLTCIRCENMVVRAESNIHISKAGVEYVRLVLGMGEMRPWRTSKPMLTSFIRAGISPLKKLRGFHVTPDAVLPVGWKLDVRHFKPGQYVDIQGKTCGKGFQGGMKRWGFRGLEATHGVSISHRALGSTGNIGQGHVIKGKKMPGNMGNKIRTTKRLLVYKVDVERNLIFIKGSVHGKPGTWVRITDTNHGRRQEENLPPFPTFIAGEGDMEVKEVYAPPDKAGDPFTEPMGLRESPNANII